MTAIKNNKRTSPFRQFKKETGIKNTNFQTINDLMTYINWLTTKIDTPQILTWIKTMFEHAEKKHWFETYWVFDLQGTISIPDYRKGIKKDLAEKPVVTYYPFAKEVLQILSERSDTVIIMFTSSYPEEIEYYNEVFKKDGINFKYINENPEISSAKGSFGFYEKKMYFNVLFDDKAGFNPNTDWEPIYDYLKEAKYRPDSSWSMKHKEDYHK